MSFIFTDLFDFDLYYTDFTDLHEPITDFGSWILIAAQTTYVLTQNWIQGKSYAKIVLFSLVVLKKC